MKNKFLLLINLVPIAFSLTGVNLTESSGEKLTSLRQQARSQSLNWMNVLREESEHIRIPKGMNIFNFLKSKHHKHKDHFLIEAFDNSVEEVVNISVKKANMAVTSATTYNLKHGRNFDPNNIEDMTILISDPSELKGMTLMVVDGTKNETKGVKKESGAPSKRIWQENTEGSLMVEEISKVFNPPVWSCGGAEGMDEIVHPPDESLFVQHDHHHHQSNFDDLPPNGFQGLVTSDERRLRGSKSNSHISGRQLYPTDTFPNAYSYQIDLFIEIDEAIINKQGGADEAVKYVNTVISAVSSIFERELDVHLNVVHILESDLYNETKSPKEALKIMRATYRGRNEWHFTDGNGIDLHHALLGRKLKGGVAYVDAVCDYKWGFGVSGDLTGDYNDIGDGILWDIIVIAHELGHNLGSGHTFDAYDPPVDTCGSKCPKDLPLDSSATIMSYCHLCSGAIDNIAYTFGGVWTGAEPRSDVDNWEDSLELDGSISSDPRRVSKNIWDHISNKGECIKPASPVPTQEGCEEDSDCDDDNECTIDKCVSSECVVSSFNEGCCGNGICEENEEDTCASDCGPFFIRPHEFCESCFEQKGFMIDIGTESDAFDSIKVNEVKVKHSQPSTASEMLDIYVTHSGSYVGKENSSSEWTKVGTATVTDDDFVFTDVKIDPPIFVGIGETRGFYAVASESIILFGEGTYEIVDDQNVILRSGRAVSDLFADGIDGRGSFELKYTLGEVPESSVPDYQPGSGSSRSSDVTSSTFVIELAELCHFCIASPGVMFNVMLNEDAKDDIGIISISFEHTQPSTGNVIADLYTTSEGGAYVGKETSSTDWKKVASVTLPESNFVFTKITLDKMIILQRGETRGFYISTPNNLLVLGEDPYEIMDSRGVSLISGRQVSGLFHSGNEGYSWDGKVEYILLQTVRDAVSVSTF